MPYVQFRVHPGVGCARMGNSLNAYYLASEFPQFMQEEFPSLRFKPKPRRHPIEFFNDETALTADGDLSGFEVYRPEPFRSRFHNKFKEDVGIIFPQAARFRVFAYVYAEDGSTHPDSVFEVTTDIAEIKWQVNVGNKKTNRKHSPDDDAEPSNNLTTTPSELATAGAQLKCERVRPVAGLPSLAYLFLERNDADKSKVTGRLHVIGNEGDLLMVTRKNSSGQDVPSRISGLWSNNWYDSAGDGSVEAFITPKGNGAPLRSMAGAATADDLKYLEYGLDTPQPGTSPVIRAVRGWVVVACPDYVPDMGHFVSLWDLALSRGIYALDARQARRQTGRHNHIVLRNKVESYLKMDYLVHIHPQLCLFEDVRYVSGEAFGDPEAFATQDRGHNKLPLVPAEPTDPDIDIALTKKVEHGGAFIHARSRKAELADETRLKDPDHRKPMAEWLKVAVYQRMRKPHTLYDRRRKFLVNPPPVPPAQREDKYEDGVFPRKVGGRMDFDKPAGTGDKGRYYDIMTYKSPPGSLRKFHGLKDKGHLCGGDKSPPLEGPPGSSLSSKDLTLLRYMDDMYWPASFADMPMLRELAFTHLQYDHFGLWQAIDYAPSEGRHTAYNVRSDNIFDQIVPRGLATSFAGTGDADDHFATFLAARPAFAPAMIDMAHLGAMLGGSFLPGIEVGREAGFSTNWSLFHGGTRYFPDIRFKPCDDVREHTVGSLTKDLAVPWSEDFAYCGEAFWPTSRPGMVFPTAAEADRKYWMLYPQVLADTAADTREGDIIPHLGRKTVRDQRTGNVAVEDEYVHEYWKSLGFIRRTPNDDFIVGD
jgi:hypothetical protein